MSDPTLTDKVNSVLATLSSDIAEQKLELPTPPDTLLVLKKMVNTPHIRVEEIVRLLRREPSISARLIKVANSVLFGSRNHVTTVKSAVLRLGTKNVHNLVVGLTITQQFLLAKTKGLELQLKKAWQQSSQVAAICNVLARHKTTQDPEIAMLAGLVHNIGMLPLYMRLNTIPELRDDPKLLDQVCHKVVPKLYAQAGGMITKSWNFSAEITLITRSHEDLNTTEDGPADIKDIVSVAHQLYLHQNAQGGYELPVTLTESPVFKKFWPDALSAITELEAFAEEISDINKMITS